MCTPRIKSRPRCVRVRAFCFRLNWKTLSWVLGGGGRNEREDVEERNVSFFPDSMTWKCTVETAGRCVQLTVRKLFKDFRDTSATVRLHVRLQAIWDTKEEGRGWTFKRLFSFLKVVHPTCGTHYTFTMFSKFYKSLKTKSQHYYNHVRTYIIIFILLYFY